MTHQLKLQQDAALLVSLKTRIQSVVQTHAADITDVTRQPVWISFGRDEAPNREFVSKIVGYEFSVTRLIELPPVNITRAHTYRVSSIDGPQQRGVRGFTVQLELVRVV